MRTIDEDYQDAAENLFGVDSVFDNVEAVIEDDELDVDWAVDRLYNTVYG